MTTHPALERLTDEIPAFAADVSSYFPSDWAEQIFRCSTSRSRWQVLDGASVTSREAEFPDRMPPRVGVVSGEVVAAELAWLDSLYRGKFLEIVNTVGDGAFEVCSDIRAGVNINATPRGARYEWHVDSNPMTGLLFATTHEPEDGGQLVFRPDPVARPHEDWELQVSPRAGTLLIFDAREAAHVVTQLRTELRLSVPMNYYHVGQQARPEDLDAYLYDR
jgi:hypothetical protein